MLTSDIFKIYALMVPVIIIQIVIAVHFDAPIYIYFLYVVYILMKCIELRFLLAEKYNLKHRHFMRLTFVYYIIFLFAVVLLVFQCVWIILHLSYDIVVCIFMVLGVFTLLHSISISVWVSRNHLQLQQTTAVIQNSILCEYTGEQQKQCSICMEEYQILESILQLQCSHQFHESCINMYITTQQLTVLNCPLCKTEHLIEFNISN